MPILTGARIGYDLPRLPVSLARVGMASPSALAYGLIDTGADYCVVHPQLLAEIGVVIGPADLHAQLAGASVAARRANVSLTIRDAVSTAEIVFDPIEVVVMDNMQERVIIGWQALRHLELEFTREGAFALRR